MNTPSKSSRPFPLPKGLRAEGARARISELYHEAVAEQRARGAGSIQVGGVDSLALGLAIVTYLEETEAKGQP